MGNKSSSPRSSVVTADSGRASSSSTFKSQVKEDKRKRSKKMVVCRVALLDGTTFEPEKIDKNCDGQVVFDKVIKQLDIIESDYFGLTFRDKSGKKFWLDNTKKVSKQVNGGTWVFEFQVKFYPPDPMSLKEDVTRYQLCLQVRVDLFNGRLPCSFSTYALLGSYTVQGELGDWSEKDCGTTTAYLNDFDFAPGQNEELLEKIAELHKNHKGMSPAMAEAHFLENAKKLAMYGVDMHDVKDFENKRLSLGVCANGILVYKDRLRVSRFVWPKILKLSYKRDSFYVKIRPGEFEPHERTISFRCDSHKLAKRLWKTCVEHHAFFRLKTADPPNSDTLFPRFNTRFRYSGRTAAQARKAAEMTDREEPHIARTAERKSMSEKNKMLEQSSVQKPPYDENDMFDKKDNDAEATLEKDGRSAGLYGQNQKAPNGDDAADRIDQRAGGEPGTEGPPGYSADTSALSDGGKKTKKEKEEEKKRKKEEEKRRKEEEKGRKKLEKELEKQRKKGKGAQETGDVHDASLMEQKEKEKEKEEKRSSGGLFGLLRRSQRDKSEKGAKGDKADEQKEKLKENFMQLLRETPDITSTSRLSDVEHKIDHDPRYKAVDADTRQRWFNEYVDDMLKSDYMRLLRDTPSIDSQSTWPEARTEIDGDPRFHAVPTEEMREEWFNEYIQSLLKEDFMQLLRETPDITSTSRLSDVEHKIEHDPRYQAVDADTRQRWFNEYVNDMLKADFMRLLHDTPSINRQSKWPEARAEIDSDSRFQAVHSEELREKWFNEYIQAMLKEDFLQLLRETPDITSTSRLSDVEHKIEHDPRYKAVDAGSRQRWFNEYVNDMLKSDFMRLLRETPSINSQSTWPDAREEIDNDPRFHAVPRENQREQWFNEYKEAMIKAEYMQLLRDTPMVTSEARFDDVKVYIENDPRYQAVPTEKQRADYFNEYVNNLKKEEFMQLLSDTPSITCYSKYPDARVDICHDPRFVNVDTEEQRKQYFNEHTDNLKKEGFVQLLQDTPDITAYSEFHQSKHLIDTDPRYHAVNSDLLRAKWFNEYVNHLAGRNYGDVDYGLRIGGYKSIDRKLEFMPIHPPTLTKKKEEPMPFFERPGETDVDSLGRKKKPPPVAKKPRNSGGYDSEEDRLLHSQTGVYKTERDGVSETTVVKKITVTSDDNDDIDHDALLRAAIEEVTQMNPDMSVEKIECVRQIEEVN